MVNIDRSFDPKRFQRDVGHLVSPDAIGFDPEKLVFNLHNLLLKAEDSNDYSLFEYMGDGVYYGHYFFDEARGKKAISLANTMIEEVKRINPEAKSIRGVVAQDNKKAIWITRKLGFLYVYTQETELGPMDMFTKSLKDDK